LRDARVGDAPAAIPALSNPGEALVGLERVAAGSDEIDRGFEIAARERSIRRGCAHFVVKLVGQKWFADGAAKDMLGQDIQGAGARCGRVLRIFGHGIERGTAF
jgi:hypothetical protein